MNLKVISRNVGFALLASAFMMFVSILVSIDRGNDSALAALIISFTLTFVVGVFPFIFVRHSGNISLKDGYMIIILSWTLSFIFGMLPFLLWGGQFSVINALYEAVSGYTTTGSTILTNVEALPDSLLFWRSSTHFIGGLGVVVFLLLIIPASSPVRLKLTNMELSSLSREGYRSRANKTVWIFTFVYLGLNIAAIICYKLAGMSLFDAVNHGFSAVATGGFSTRNMSIGAYDSPMIDLVSMIFMFLGSIHFGLIYMVFASRSLNPLRNPVLKFYVLVILAFGIFSSIGMKFGTSGYGWGDSLLNGFFHTISFISTTGFAISDNNNWPVFVNVALLLLMIPCGMAGSTTGGVKIDRFLLLIKAAGQQIRRSMHPASINQIHVGNNTLKDYEIYPHIVFLGIYVLFCIASVLITTMLGMDFDKSVASAVSCFSNAGPGIGEMGTLGNYSSVPVVIKLVFIIDMFMGRVELYPFIAVMLMIFSGKNR